MDDKEILKMQVYCLQQGSYQPPVREMVINKIKQAVSSKLITWEELGIKPWQLDNWVSEDAKTLQPSEITVQIVTGFCQAWSNYQQGKLSLLDFTPYFEGVKALLASRLIDVKDLKPFSPGDYWEVKRLLADSKSSLKD